MEATGELPCNYSICMTRDPLHVSYRTSSYSLDVALFVDRLISSCRIEETCIANGTMLFMRKDRPVNSRMAWYVIRFHCARTLYIAHLRNLVCNRQGHVAGVLFLAPQKPNRPAVVHPFVCGPADFLVLHRLQHTQPRPTTSIQGLKGATAACRNRMDFLFKIGFDHEILGRLNGACRNIKARTMQAKEGVEACAGTRTLTWWM